MRVAVYLSLLWCVGINLGVLPGSQVVGKNVQLTPDQPQVEINVGLNATLVWRYKVKANTYYTVLWGIRDKNSDNIRQDGVFFEQTDNGAPQLRPVPTAYAGRVFIVDQASLVIVNARLSDEGQYICEIATFFTTVKKSIHLRVVDPPKITRHPTSQLIISEGTQHHLICQTSGKPIPDVKWIKNNRLVGNIRKGRADIDLNPVSDRDAGSYKCVATNSGGSREFVTNVTVKFSPKETHITTDAVNNTVGQHRTITISCRARGFPTPKYRFYRITSTGQTKLIYDNDAMRSGRLMVDVISQSQAGVYICEPYNINGNGQRQQLDVRVRYPPRITTKPDDVASPKEFEQVTMRCEASGYPPPKITWIKLQTNEKVGNGNTHMFHSIRRQDSGMYKCVAKNGVGRPAEAFVRIKVKYAPKINKTLTKDRVAAFPGQTVVLRCVADGMPVPRYLWNTPSGSQIQGREGNGTVSVKMKNNNSFGWYVCFVQNDHGSDTFAVAVEKVEKPSPVTHFTVQGTTSTTVSLKWTQPIKSGSSRIKNYVIKYSEDENVWITIVIKPEKTSYLVTGLLPYTEYTFKIRATNEHFSSDPVKLSKTTNEAAPGAPEHFAIDVINSTAVSLSWSEPKRPNGRIVRYQITYRVVTTIPQYPNRVSCPQNVTSYVLGRLNPFTNYTIDVMAWNGIPGGNKSALFITTLQQAPGIPRDLSFNYTGGQTIQLKWRPPRVLNGIVVGLRVKLEWWRNDTTESSTDVVEDRAVARGTRFKRVTSGDGHEIVVEQVEPLRSVAVRNLMFYSMYRLSVSEGTGSQRVLWGPFTNVTRTIMTPEGVPTEPRNLKIIETTLTSLTITWQKPVLPNGRIRMYTVQYWNSSNVFTWMLTSSLNNESFLILLADLKPLTLYQIAVQAHTLYPGKRSDIVSAKTEEVGSTSAQKKEINSASLLGGVSTGVVLLGFIIIGVFIFYRNRKKKRDSAELHKGRYAVANSNDSGIGEKDSVEGGMRYVHSTPRRGSEDDGPGNFKKRKPIPVNKLKEYCEINHSDRNKRFKEEFLSIRASGNVSWDHSHRAENKSKNRYTNIVAYDGTRVVLTEKDSFPGSDYINANYIDGYTKKSRFIATQGPMASTFGDFWRMIWEQGTSVIVMVTNAIEKGRVKCLKYWPSADPEVYGSVIVTPTEEEELADYTVRKFTIEMTSGTVEFPRREVTQYHFTAWPDHGVPSHATSLLSFLRHIRRALPDDVGPIVCHCSAGVGRTGTFIVLDAMLDQMMTEGVVDIYGFVTHIRNQRNQMVQTEAQYIFIHDALLEAAMCGDTEIKVQNLQDRLKVLASIDPTTRQPYLQAEFRNLEVAINERGTFLSASIPENKIKNRYAILPYDSTRVKLWPYAGKVGSDYVNANFIDSYQQREAFIATQAPLEHTRVDFWRMIWEYESYTVVMLTMPFESNEYAVYLPKKGEYSMHGLLKVEIDYEEMRNGYFKRQLKVTNSKSGAARTLYHFHYVEWPENSVARSSSGLIDMLKNITKAQQVSGNGPITVHCSDGSGRTGTFCAISTGIERVKLDGTVDMFQVVRKLREQRPLMVQTIDQYRYCYDVVNEFVELHSA